WIGGRGRPPHKRAKGKGRSCFHDRPLFMPATTYSPTHLARAVQSALRGLTSVFGMGTGVAPAVRSPTTCSSSELAVSKTHLCSRQHRADAILATNLKKNVRTKPHN